MITIQGFAKLCGCNAQTLRYYDKIGLLKPAKVDEWTGYRYYEEDQALIFVKIKNLQQADFSIEEIRELLDQDDEAVVVALDKKLEEQKQKLEQIRKIQRSYLEEIMDMKKLVNELSNCVEEQVSNPKLWAECGIDVSKETEYVAKAKELLADWLAKCKEMNDTVTLDVNEHMVAEAAKISKELKKGNWKDAQRLVLSKESSKGKGETIPPNAEIVFERHDWEHVSDWLPEVPARKENETYDFQFQLTEGSPALEPGFTTFFLVLMASGLEVFHGMNCRVDLSKDGRNHFVMYRE